MIYLTIKKDKQNEVETTLIKEDVKSILYCKSFLKGKKEQAMKTQFREIFEEGLKEVVASLTKKGSSKRYEKVLARLIHKS